jgi:hypothetical protein
MTHACLETFANDNLSVIARRFIFTPTTFTAYCNNFPINIPLLLPTWKSIINCFPILLGGALEIRTCVGILSASRKGRIEEDG